ncbi:MAG: cation diffusion facilitator family transporter, partial [Bacteroidota bacterium]
DAVHDLGDSLSLGLAWYRQRLSQKGSDSHYSYGYKRFSILGAIITCLILVLGSVFILYEAIPRLLAPEETYAPGMMALACLGIVVNGIAVLRLRTGNSLNEEAMYWHLLEDVLGWVVVLIGSITMYFFGLPWIDPLLSIGITLYILFNVLKRLIGATKIVLQAVPEGIEIEEVRNQLEQIDGIHEVPHIHLWSLDGQYHLGSIRAKVVAGDTSLGALLPLKKKIRQLLHDEFHIEQVSIEFEGMEECGHQKC